MNANLIPLLTPAAQLPPAAGKPAGLRQNATPEGFMAVLASLLSAVPIGNPDVCPGCETVGVPEITEITEVARLPDSAETVTVSLLSGFPPATAADSSENADETVQDDLPVPIQFTATVPATGEGSKPDGPEELLPDTAAPATSQSDMTDRKKTAVQRNSLLSESPQEREPFPSRFQNTPRHEPLRLEKEPGPRDESLDRTAFFRDPPARTALETPAAQVGKMAVSRNNVMGQVLEKMVFTRDTDGDSTLVVRLKPAVLGEVQINLRMEDGRLTARILTENLQVKEALEASLAQLRQRLESQQIHVAEMTVSVGHEHGGRQSRESGTFRNNNRYGGRGNILSEEELTAVSAAGIPGLVDIRA